MNTFDILPIFVVVVVWLKIWYQNFGVYILRRQLVRKQQPRGDRFGCLL